MDKESKNNDALYALIGDLGRSVASIFRKVPENVIYQPEGQNTNLIKYLLWFVLGISALCVVFFIGKNSSKKRR